MYAGEATAQSAPRARTEVTDLGLMRGFVSAAASCAVRRRRPHHHPIFSLVLGRFEVGSLDLACPWTKRQPQAALVCLVRALGLALQQEPRVS